MFRVRHPEKFDLSAEFGMGYHLGIRSGVSWPNNSTKQILVVLNGEIAFKLSELHRQSRLSLAANDIAQLEVVDVDVLEDLEVAVKSTLLPLALRNRLAGQQHVHGSPPHAMTLPSSQHLVRYTAFAIDRRRTSGGGYVPGTYFTSISDAACVPNALAAQGRYALPTPLPHLYRFDATAPVGHSVRYGTVIPAFGQAGGGAEIEIGGQLTPGASLGPSSVLIF